MADYNPDIPQGGDNLSTSQGQILNNFTELNNIFDANHFKYNFATVGDRGLHRKIDLPVTTTVSAPSGTASVIYNKAVSGVASPYFDNAVGSSVLWRGGSSNGLASTTLANPGLLNLPNGFQVRWGTDQFAMGSATRTVTFTPAFTTTALVATVTIDETAPANYVAAQSLGQSNFLARRSTPITSAINFRWIAIGY